MHETRDFKLFLSGKVRNPVSNDREPPPLNDAESPSPLAHFTKDTVSVLAIIF